MSVILTDIEVKFLARRLRRLYELTNATVLHADMTDEEIVESASTFLGLVNGTLNSALERFHAKIDELNRLLGSLTLTEKQ